MNIYASKEGKSGVRARASKIVSYLNESEFLRLVKKGNLIPVYKEIVADMDTPVSAFFKIAQDAKYSFLLESVEGEERVARFSFLARNPELVFQSKGRRARITRLKNGKEFYEEKDIDDTPLSIIKEILQKYKFVNIPQLPQFCGGMVGYFSYEIVRFFEKLPEKVKDDLNLPDVFLMLAKDILIFDHLNHKIKVVCCIEVDKDETNHTLLRGYKKAMRKIDRLIQELRQPIFTIRHKPGKGNYSCRFKPKSNFSEERFKKIVKEAKKQIRAGEIIQVVLSQRFEMDLSVDPFEIYRALRLLNPSPYMYYLNFEDLYIIGASPELLVKCEAGIVETRPIAGTRPRGENREEDDRLAEDLLRDPKEKAEHIMLVDLGRNDLGRVCKKGTVHLSEFMTIERYSHVMHIVSNVRGELAHGKDIFDVLKATFPAGTVSGAPKIRAMEIIEDLEDVCRGPYAGCIGYFSFSGDFESCITIRTIVVTKGKAYVQAGAGIVADSAPEKEYSETINKAMAQIKAIELAHSAIDSD